MFHVIIVILTKLTHLHLSVLVRATDGEEPLEGDAEHDVDAGHEAEGSSVGLVIVAHNHIYI